MGVVVCTDLSGKEEPHRQVCVGSVLISGRLDGVIVNTQAQNGRDVGSVPGLSTIFPVFITPITAKSKVIPLPLPLPLPFPQAVIGNGTRITRPMILLMVHGRICWQWKMMTNPTMLYYVIYTLTTGTSAHVKSLLPMLPAKR